MMGALEFAEALGFDSYEKLMQASESIVSEGDIDWYITRLPDGRWAAWDDAELSLDRVEYFDTREEAAEFHQSLNEFARILIEWEQAQRGLGDMTENERLARELFATYRRYLAAFLECSEGELPAVTARLAGENFETLAVAQNAAEEAAWAEVRQNPEWPRPWSDEEAAVAEAFQRLCMEAGY